MHSYSEIGKGQPILAFSPNDSASKQYPHKWMKLDHDFIPYAKFNLKDHTQAGEMAYWSRALTVLPKILSSNPSNHMVAHNHP